MTDFVGMEGPGSHFFKKSDDYVFACCQYNSVSLSQKGLSASGDSQSATKFSPQAR